VAREILEEPEGRDRPSIVVVKSKSVYGPRTRGLGFSLVEGLVVIALVGVLLSMVLPAISRARESARQNQCRARLKQVSLAASEYEVANRYFPPGILGGDMSFEEYISSDDDKNWRSYQYSSSLALVLSYLDMGDLRGMVDAISFDTKKRLADFTSYNGESYRGFVEVPGVIDLATRQMACLVCPSDTRSKGTRYFMSALQPVSHQGSDGIAWVNLLDESTAESFGYTNYVGCTGVNSVEVISQKYSIGIMSANRPIRVSRISDGMSKTILYGEQIGKSRNGTNLIRQNWFVGGIARGRGDAELDNGSDLNSVLGDVEKSDWYGFSSAHPSQVFFVFADGHVSGFARDADRDPFFLSCGMSDG